MQMEITAPAMHSSPSNRQVRAKNSIIGRGSNVSQQTENHRTAFINRLKSLRIKEFDKLRNFNSEDLDASCLLEIRNVLAHTDEGDLATQQEIGQALEELDFLLDRENHLADYDAQLNHIEYSLMEKCSFCEEPITQGSLCDICSIEFSS